MIRTLSISVGLVGLTALSGMALSMAHDLSFAGAQRVTAEQVTPAALATPSTQAGAAVMARSDMLQATPGEAQVVPAILERSGPPNRLAGKSMATASESAPASTVAPPARVLKAALNIGDRSGGSFADEPRDTISAPVFEREPTFRYAPVAPVTVAQRPIAAAVGAPSPSRAPAPDFLIGVFR